eukprot:Hpha_TRINITY_DN15693_c0_g2::TRINITY_DN15693_c0_g2_i1::g.99299::m.99299
MSSKLVQHGLVDPSQVTGDVEDVKGCWCIKSCFCANYNCSTGEDTFFNFCCFILLPFPICRCFHREGKQTWRSCTDLKGNYEVWRVKDPQTIVIQGGNEFCGEGKCGPSEMTRCC